MTRNLKALGLALVAVFAMSALSAAGAQASNEATYHISEAPGEASGTQVAANEFHVPGAGTVACTGANFPGSVSEATVHSFRVTPEYSGCKAFGFATTDIITTNCHFLFTTPTTTTATQYHAIVHVECTSGAKIKITPTFFGSSVCTVEVGSQTPGGNVDIENKESESHVLVTSTAVEVAHTSGCGASEAADGVYTGSVTEKGVGGKKIWVT